MANDVVKKIGITGVPNDVRDIGAEAQNIEVSYDANDDVIVDIHEAGVVVDHVKPLTEALLNVNGIQYKEVPEASAETEDKIIEYIGESSQDYINGYFYKCKKINELELPYNFYKGSAVIYNNEIHILGGVGSDNFRKHCKWNGTSWSEVSTLPYDFYEGSAVVYNNEIHILGGGNNITKRSHFKWDPINGWSRQSISELPYRFNCGSAVVYNNEIHILGSYYDTGGDREHRKWNPTNGWSSQPVSELPYDFYYGSAVVYDDEIHILGGINSNKHYYWDGTIWNTESIFELPYNFDFGSTVVYNNEIYTLGGGSTIEMDDREYRKWNPIDGWSNEPISELPYKFNYGSAIIYNNEIYILGGFNNNKKFYKWNGTLWSNKIYEWENIDVQPEMTTPFIGATSLTAGENGLVPAPAIGEQNKLLQGNGTWSEELEVKTIKDENGNVRTQYNTIPEASEENEDKIIEYIGETSQDYINGYFYKCIGCELELPYEFIDGSVVVYNNEIHILGGVSSAKKHYKWNGITWEQLGNLDYDFYEGSAVVYNNEIHILGSASSSNRTKHSKWNGISWEQLGDLDYNFYEGSAVVYNNEIHILGGYNSRQKHYKWNGITWEQLGDLDYDFYEGSAVVYNNEIHILGSGDSSNRTKHYKWNGTTWEQLGNLDYYFFNGSAVVYNNEIHILGGTGGYLNHYKWNETSWEQLGNLPYTFISGSVIVYNNEIHILGSNNNDNYKKHYKWNGTTWSNVIYSWENIDVQSVITNPFVGATSSVAGSIGLVPAPQAGDQNKFLKGDGTWTVNSIPNDLTVSTLTVGNRSAGSVGTNSTVEGIDNVASGNYSHAEGQGTTAGYQNQHVQGKYNDNKSTSAFEIGNGTANNKSNALELTWDGDLTVAGNITDGNGNSFSSVNNNLTFVEETTTASKAYSVGDYLIYNGQLYKVITAITAGGTITASGVDKNIDATIITDNIIPATTTQITTIVGQHTYSGNGSNIINTDRLNQYDQATGTFTNSDNIYSNAWQDVARLASGETKPSIFAKISKMFANIRYLNGRMMFWNDNISVVVYNPGLLVSSGGMNMRTFIFGESVQNNMRYRVIPIQVLWGTVKKDNNNVDLTTEELSYISTSIAGATPPSSSSDRTYLVSFYNGLSYDVWIRSFYVSGLKEYLGNVAQ